MSEEEARKIPPRERVVPVRQSEKPPVSPYVVHFEFPESTEPSTLTSSTQIQKIFFPQDQSNQISSPILVRPEPVLESVHSQKRPAGRVKTKRKKAPFLFFRPQLRPVLIFALAALLFTGPAAGLGVYAKFQGIQASVLGKSKEALGSWPNSPRSLLEAKKELEQAAGIFGKLAPVIPRFGSLYESGSQLLSASAHLAEAVQIMTSGFGALTEPQNPSWPLTSKLIHFEEALRAALPLVHAASLELNEVKLNLLPSSLAGPVSSGRQKLAQIKAGLAEAIAFLPALEEFLGLEQNQRYLLVFQNPNELRPTGGFIGSFALVDILRGELRRIEIPGGGSYDLAGGLREHLVSPAPLHLIEPRWQFHDANWFPDFPSSARKLIWFYEKSGGPSVDGLVAVNATLVTKLLAILGPIEMPDYHRVFTADNFILETQKIVELEYDRLQNRPKALIGELAPRLIERIMTATPEQMLKLLAVLGEAGRAKEIQVYTRDQTQQTAWARVGFAGEWKKTSGDALGLAVSNIAGGKTDAVIQTNLDLQTTLEASGEVVNRLTITRLHQGRKGDLFTGQRNVSYLRVYVPIGSALIEARGFEAPPSELFSPPPTYARSDDDLLRLSPLVGRETASGTDLMEESGYTVFGNWLQVDPGRQSQAVLTYRLPPGTVSQHDFLLSYTLLVLKQSGLQASFSQKLEFPAAARVRWQTPNSVLSGNHLLTQRELGADLFLGLLLER